MASPIKKFSVLLLSGFIATTWSYPPCKQAFSPALLKSFSSYGIHVSSKPVTDYAGIISGGNCYLEVTPDNTEAVSRLIRFAAQNRIYIRVQGNAHSQNGSALPLSSELLLHTDKLNALHFDKRGQVIAGAGIPIHLLDAYIRKTSDYALPVTNSGGVGPTVGGFISAGGLSFSSRKYGGFWNHVSEITIVDGEGKIMRVHAGDELFPWLFGAMGQLGIVTEVKLNLIPVRNLDSPYYPLMRQIHIFYQHENYFRKKHNPLYWFNLLVIENQLDQAKKILGEFQTQYPGVLNYIPIYEWPIKNNRFTPPLVFNGAKNFYAAGIWGDAGAQFDKKKLISMEKAFDAIVLKQHYHRYIQAELASSPKVYTDYFEPAIFKKFLKLKMKLDPLFLFNRGTVFDKTTTLQKGT